VDLELGCAHVAYFGHVIGQGYIKTVEAKIKAVTKFSTPASQRELMYFLRMADYYWRILQEILICSRTLYLPFSKNTRGLVGTLHNYIDAFKKIKGLTMSAPVLVTPDFDKLFVLLVDASGIKAGAVLAQEDQQGA